MLFNSASLASFHMKCESISSDACAVKPKDISDITVKHVSRDHTRDQQNLVVIHRWALYGGSIT